MIIFSKGFSFISLPPLFNSETSGKLSFPETISSVIILFSSSSFVIVVLSSVIVVVVVVVVSGNVVIVFFVFSSLVVDVEVTTIKGCCCNSSLFIPPLIDCFGCCDFTFVVVLIAGSEIGVNIVSSDTIRFLGGSR